TRLALEAYRVGEGKAEAAIDERLVAAHRLRIAGEHVARERAARGHELVRLDHAVDEPPFRGKLGGHEVAGQRDFLGAKDADQAWQLLAETPARKNSDARMSVGEARLTRSDQDVASERDLDPAGDREAVDRADDRL